MSGTLPIHDGDGNENADKTIGFNAMSHGAIFLATCLATITTEKHCKLQRGCHTFAIFLRNLQRTRWKLFSTLSLAASLESPASKRRTLIGSLSQNCVAGCDGYVTRSNLSRNVAKS